MRWPSCARSKVARLHAVAIPLGTLAGVALAKYRVRYAKTIQLYLLLPFTIPLIGSGIGLMLIFGKSACSASSGRSGSRSAPSTCPS